jgi:hypothetical protein
VFHFNIDPTVLIYLLFIAAVLLNASFKKGRRPPPSETTRPEQDEPATADAINLPRAPLPEVPPRPLPRAKPDRLRVARANKAQAAQPSQHAPVREPELQSGKERPAVTRGLRAVRFTNRDDLRHAIVARLVIGPPKSLQ